MPSELGMQWKEYYGNFHEDGYLCVHKRDELESQEIIFAKKDIALNLELKMMIDLSSPPIHLHFINGQVIIKNILI